MTEKIKVESLEIITNMVNGEPYYEIKYKEVGKDHYNIGYSSYKLENVLEWKKDCFEFVGEKEKSLYGMTENEAINLMQIEKECINRDCDRDCRNCDIVQKVENLNNAYNLAIEALKTVQEMKKRNLTIEHIENYVRFEDECVDKGFTFKSLIEAREKQIPKKPILKNGESGAFVDYEDGHGEYKVTKWQDWVCPKCGWFVGQRYNAHRNGSKLHSHDQRKSEYCNECGQKIDWR